MIKKDQITSRLNIDRKKPIPRIYGEFTKWKPQYMIPVNEFVNKIRLRKEPNFLKMVIKMSKLDGKAI